METNDIVNNAIENLFTNTGIRARWKALTKKDIQGKLTLQLKPAAINFNVEVKREIRNHHLPALINKAGLYENFMLIADYIFPILKKDLRNHNIAYIETPGNIYFKNENHFIWIDANKKENNPREIVNRAFAKTGLKAVFLFLLNDKYINTPYRELAKLTGIGLGNFNYIINGLKEQGFILMVNKKEMKLINKKELLERWIGAYEARLKPTLLIGNFTFAKKDFLINWKNIKINNTETLWGGEPAANLLTKYLHPEIFTIYTNENRQKLIPELGIVPDTNGKVQIYKKFWNENTANQQMVPPLLVYADLINTGDARCLETANMIFEKYLKDNIR